MAAVEWFNPYYRSDLPFQFFLGGRGIGKTYGALSSFIKEHRSEKIGKLIYMRMSETELEVSASASGNSFKAINRDFGYNYKFTPEKKIYRIIEEGFDEDNKPMELSHIGYGASLSALGNVRGVDFSDSDLLYFDEFIPSDNSVKRPVEKKAGYLFSNAYETFSRNRELLGKPPLRCIFTANSFSMENDILKTFGVLPMIEEMFKSGQTRRSDRQRGVYVELCASQNVSELKKDTALYKAIISADMRRLALENKFDDKALHLVRKTVALSEYAPIASYFDYDSNSNIVIYKHKTIYEYYAKISNDKGVPEELQFNKNTIGKFLITMFDIYKTALLENRMYFDEVTTKMILDKVLDRNIKP